MINGQKIVVVMPAYNAEQTLEKTYQALPHEVIDHVIVVDDASDDHTEQVARKLDGVHVIRHSSNMGYGANQKTCYRKALELGGDVVVMVHPDYQYEPRLVTAMASMIAQGVYDAVIASRILGTGALAGGMPLQVHRQSSADCLPEFPDPIQIIRVPQRLPGVFPQGAGKFTSRRKF